MGARVPVLLSSFHRSQVALDCREMSQRWISFRGGHLLLLAHATIHSRDRRNRNYVRLRFIPSVYAGTTLLAPRKPDNSANLRFHVSFLHCIYQRSPVPVASGCRVCISGVLSSDESILRLCYRHCLGAVARFAALATNTRAAKSGYGFRARVDLVCSVPPIHALIDRGTSGGMSLYWISTPYPNELGSWFSVADVKEKPELAPHRDFFAKLEQLSDVERDDALKKQAVYNISHHPAKYVANWAANVGRLLFSYPFSLGSDRLTTYFYMVPNMFVVVLFLLSLFPAILRAKAIPFEMWALLIFALIAFGGSTLLSAYDRQFQPLVPILYAWTGFVYVRVLRIELRGGNA